MQHGQHLTGYSADDHRLLFFTGPEAPEQTESAAKEQAAEKQDVDFEAIGKQKAAKLAELQAAEKAAEATEQIQETVIAQKIEAQPTPEVMDAIARVEALYRQFAVRWSTGDDRIDMTTADPAMEPIRRAWNETRLGPERSAIEDALNAVLRRATADTPNVQFRASGSGGSLGIGGSRVGGPKGGSRSERATDRPEHFPTVAPALRRFIAYLQLPFERASMERTGLPALDRFNRQSTLAVAGVSPGTRWNGADASGQLQPDSLVPGAYNLDFRFRTALPREQQDHFMDMVVNAANGNYGASGTADGIRIQSLTPQQIILALAKARQWEQAHSAGDRARDQLRGMPLADRTPVLDSYRLLQTDVQRAYFRTLMGQVALDTQIPLARVLARLTSRMTQDLADGGPLHEPDISRFQPQLRTMSRAEKEALRQLPIGDRAIALWYPGIQDDR